MMITDAKMVKHLRELGKRKNPKEVAAEAEPKKYTELLYSAENAYSNLEGFRKRRQRAKHYLEGDQWCELMYNPKDLFGQSMIKEEDYIRQDGRIPFKQNILSQLTTNIVGQYRKNPNKSNVVARARNKQDVSEMLSNAMQAALDVNTANELDAYELRELIVSGFSCGKVTYEWDSLRQVNDAKLRNCQPNMMFFSTPITDPRVDEDLSLIGEIHEMTLDEIYQFFAKTEADKARIRRIFGDVSDTTMLRDYASGGLNGKQQENVSFFIPCDPNKFRVYEIWSKEYQDVMYVHDRANGSYTRTDFTEKEIDAINEARMEQGLLKGIPPEEVAMCIGEKRHEGIWYVHYLGPNGECLFESETPYAHGSHPYCLTLHPLLDGNVYGLIDNVIDQQRYINRLLALMDATIGASAKNLLAVPESAVSDNMSFQEMVSEWSKTNGAILFNDKNGLNLPQVISATAINTDANSLLQLQLSLINQISGLNGALQGQAPKAGTPSSLYAQQAENSAINIADLMAVFGAYKKKRDKKVLQTIMQYYKEKRLILLSGSAYKKAVDEYDPDMVTDVDAEVVVATSTDTPIYRQIQDNLLMQLAMANILPVEVMLENSSFQGADKIAEEVRRIKEQQQQALASQQAAMAAQPIQQ